MPLTLEQLAERVEQHDRLYVDLTDKLSVISEEWPEVRRMVGALYARANEHERRLVRVENGEDPEHAWGRRDSDFEVTSSGAHVRVDQGTFRHMQQSLANIEREREVNKQVVKRLKGLVKIGLAVGAPIATAIGWLLHLWQSGGLHHLLGP